MVDTITGSYPAFTKRRRAAARAAWVAARARNAIRRPWRMSAVAGVVFIVSLLLLILAPRGARREIEEAAPLANQWVDTLPLLKTERDAERTLSVADSTLAVRRSQADRPLYVPAPDTVPPVISARRQTLTDAESELSRLLTRVENAPLPASYRALAEAATLRDDPRIRALVDTLADVEKAREEFGAGGGVDPIFVSLTTRANAIGRAIKSVAESKRTAMREEITAVPHTLRAPSPVVAAPVDTATAYDVTVAAMARLAAATATVVAGRRTNAEIEERLTRARAQANGIAPPIAILAAALILGLSSGFGWVLIGELKTPRAADIPDVERATGARVFAVVRPREIPAERARRRADRALPPLIDPTSDAYKLLASHASAAAGANRIVTLAGDNAAVTATIAANIAVASATEARSTLLVDADFDESPVADVLQLGEYRGLSSVFAGELDWAAATRQANVGRDRTVDVLPAGRAPGLILSRDQTAMLRSEVQRIARRYDLVIVVASGKRARQARAAPNVLVCAHVANTPLSTLKSIVADLREDGAQITGIVLWDALAPQLGQPQPTEDQPLVADTGAGRPSA
jgi:Mrp family chromosome partitioning ATPase